MADARLYLFIGIFVLVYFLESIGGSYLVSAVQAIERQFQIPSKVSGFLVSASDMGYIPSVIFVSYYGGLSNRAKWIGFGTILIALAHISIAMPNFIFPVQQPKLNLTKIEIQLMPSNLLISTEASIIDFMTYIPIMERIPDDLKHLIEEKIRTHKNIDKSRLLKYSKDHDQIHNQSISENDNVGEENQGGETTYSVDSDLITDIFTSFPKWLDGKITDKTMLNKLQKYANNRKQNMKQDIKTLRKAAIAPFAFCGKLVNDLRDVLFKYKCENANSNVGALLIIFGSLLVLGLGRSTPWCLGIPLIDDTIKKKSLMPIYFAGVSFIRILGPICGFVLGSMMNKIYYTSFVPTGLTPKDPTWIGRWWLGFLLIGIVTLIPSLALFFFPNPTAKSVDKTKELEDDMKKKEKKGLVLSDKPTVKDTEENQITKTLSEKAKEFVVSYKPVIQSKVYLGVVLGRTCDILAFKGYMVFLPKYLENHYGIPQYKVHLAIAGFGVFGFASGTINGGILTKLYKLTGRQAAILVFIISAINCSFFLGKTFLGCHSIVNSVGAKGLQTHFNFTESCNVDCSCESSTIYPVCTETGVPFYSPCHAGCRGVNVISQNPIQLEFSNCECAPGSIVKKEFCKDDCEWMTKIFFVTVILGGFVAGTGVVPGMLLLIRSVPPETRSISLGLQGFVVSLIGTLPSPILYGAVIDSACLVWDRTCGDGDGHCSIYDPTKLRVRLHLLYCCIRLISMMTDIWVIYYSKHINILEEVKGTEETDEANDLAMKTFPPQPIAE